MPISSPHRQKSLSWNEGEKRIHKEMEWLGGAIPTFYKEEINTPITCKDCLTRRIAIHILSGAVKAREITKKPPLDSFWMSLPSHPLQQKQPKISHGKEWHSATMEKIENHFLHLGYEVAREPNLHWGRADLGAYRDNLPSLYIEVGTTSFFKIWLNLEMMREFVYIIVPDDERIIEFTREK